MVVKAEIVTGGNLKTLSCLLVIKSEEGNKVTFSHWPKLDTLFATQACQYNAANEKKMGSMQYFTTGFTYSTKASSHHYFIHFSWTLADCLRPSE